MLNKEIKKRKCAFCQKKLYKKHEDKQTFQAVLDGHDITFMLCGTCMYERLKPGEIEVVAYI